jgi:alpha-tubulin suppressor-like RCC1 family protein
MTRSPDSIAALLLVASVAVTSGCGPETGSPTEPEFAESAVAAPAFSIVSTYDDHTCGLTTDGLAYCWGDNLFGELGDGTTTSQRTSPSAVAGGHQFINVTAGSVLSCGVATDRRAWCWGFLVGDGTLDERRTPVLVRGDLRFYQIVAGEFHTCGVTYPDRRAFCWGDNQFGQLGDGTTTERHAPVQVTGGLRFREVTLGRFHTCAVTTSDVAYCWGLG